MVYVFLADGFETVEALCPIDLMRRAGLEVTTVSIKDTLTVTSRQEITLFCDAPLESVDIDKAELLMLPGGMPGSDNLAKCGELCALLTEAAERDIPLAAICAAPYVLGMLGLLRGKRATCYPGFEGLLEGAMISSEPVVRDGNTVTGAGMGAATEFGLELVSLLCSEEKAEQIASSVLFKR